MSLGCAGTLKLTIFNSVKYCKLSGVVCPQDKWANDRAVKGGERLLSVYHSKDGVKFWIITEWDRSATTVLLPEDY